MTSLSSDADETPCKPRFCLLKKSYPEQEYGFDLHAEKLKGQFIGNVEPDSVADSAGLKRGDRIIAVNDVRVANETHKEVVKRIKEDPLQCRFVVISEEGYLWYTSRKMSVPIVESAQQPMEKIDSPIVVVKSLILDDDSAIFDNRPNSTDTQQDHVTDPQEIVVDLCDNVDNDVLKIEEKFDSAKPRLCKLRKTNITDEYGFNLHAEKGKGHFVGKVDQKSIADRSGMLQGYRIVGVNGTLIYIHSAHKDVVNLIKHDPLATDLLIASPQVDDLYAKRQNEFSFENAEIFQFLPSSPKLSIPSPNGSAKNIEIENDSSEKDANNSHVNGNGTCNYVQSETVQNTTIQNEINGVNDITLSPNSKTNGHGQTVDIFAMSASQMRELVSRHKKTDPRKEQITLREKYEIVQNL